MSHGRPRPSPIAVAGEAAGRVELSLSGRSGLTILVADDHAHSARILQRTLEAAGHEVLLAADGEEAWRVIEQGRARVVIADWVMPGLDGPDLCRRIRGRAGRPYTYVILVTGRAGGQDRLMALIAGADDFLTKPLDPRQLNARLEVAQRLLDSNGDLERMNARLTELATTDDLTGLKNRRHFREALESAFSLAARQGLPLSLVLFDVDHFKSLNDAFGHPAGDGVLKALAAILRDQVRPYDQLARHGCEEFALILIATDADGARAVAERMRAAIAGHPWPLHPVTASFGVATIPPDCVSALDLVDAADRALYHSKERGRNLVTHFDDLSYPPDRTCSGPEPFTVAPRFGREPLQREFTSLSG
jgi:diguanylate cyclase (GGDEF)-like protein